MYMNIKFLNILLTTCLSFGINFCVNAQDVWYEYIVGRPNVDYVEAKKKITKQWGIQYQPIISGCVYTEQIEHEMDSFQQINAPYLDQLDKQFGPSWQQILNEDIQLAIIKSKANGLSWKEPIFGRPNMSYFNQKKQFLSSLGITYEAVFKNCSPNNLSDADQTELDESNAFKNTLYNIMGRTWEALFEKRIRQSYYQTSGHEIVWDEFIKTNGSDKAYQEERSKIINNWGIQHKLHLVSACKYKKLTKDGHIAASQVIEDQITKQLGSDWKDRVHIQTVHSSMSGQ